MPSISSGVFCSIFPTAFDFCSDTDTPLAVFTVGEKFSNINGKKKKKPTHLTHDDLHSQVFLCDWEHLSWERPFPFEVDQCTDILGNSSRRLQSKRKPREKKKKTIQNNVRKKIEETRN